MDVRFVPPDLRKLDQLDVDAVVLPVHADERPLRGATGLVDWRLSGRLSTLIARGRLRGLEGERVLVSTQARLAFDKVVLIGVGESAALDATVARGAIDAMLDVLDGLRARKAALALPGRTLGRLEAEAAMDVLAPRTLDPHEQDILIVIDASDEHRALARSLEAARRKARALD